ncbi:MAG: hypothetical protein IJU82_03655 [Ruminiclostridium sp.]|nr:hypothetical protein [Ruminiclostridium sp.]
MSEAWDNELLAGLGELFSKAGGKVSTEELSGKKVLVIESDEAGGIEDANITVEHFPEDITVISLLFSVASDLDEKARKDITALLPYLNRCLTIGNFGITAQDGYFYFRTAFVIDEASDRDILFRTIASTFGIAVVTADEAAKLTAPVIRGEKPVSELMNDDTGIIQF